MLQALKKFFKQNTCPHEATKFVRNIHGQEIIDSGYKRSVWQCKECDKYIYQPYLNDIGQ